MINHNDVDVGDVAIILNCKFFEDYLRKYKDIIEDNIKALVISVIELHKDTIVEHGIDEETMRMYDPDKTDKCYVCDLVVADIGKRAIHVMEHLQQETEGIIDITESMNILKWLVSYGEYMNAMLNDVDVEERLPILEDMTRALGKSVLDYLGDDDEQLSK